MAPKEGGTAISEKTKISRKKLGIQILLVLFSLEVDRVATIIVGITNGLGWGKVEFDSFAFLQAQAVISAAAISIFICLTYYIRFSVSKKDSKLEIEKRIVVQSELVTTVVVMAVASSLVVFSDLVKIKSATGQERWSVVLFVFLYLFVVISPLVHSEKYSGNEIETRYNRMRVILTSVVLCYVAGLAIHWMLKQFNIPPVFETEEFLALGFLWYSLALEPLRHRSEWKSISSSCSWVALYTLVGFLAGSLYGSMFYSGRTNYMNSSGELPALIYWGMYGLVPILSCLLISRFIRKKTSSDWVYKYALCIFGVTLMSVLLHDVAKEPGGLVVGIVTGIASFVIIYIPEKYLEKSIAE